MTQRDVPGFAIGGLSGGEEKDDFWRMVTLSTDHLPREKPRYLMGVGSVCLHTVYFPMAAPAAVQHTDMGNVCVSAMPWIWWCVSLWDVICSTASSPHELQ